jgi:hypothetical protein
MMLGSVASPSRVQLRCLSVVVLEKRLTSCVDTSTQCLAIRSSTLPLMTENAEVSGWMQTLTIGSGYYCWATNVLFGTSVYVEPS